MLMPEVFGQAGGIQSFCRSLCLAAGRWAEAHDASLNALVLNDSGEPDSRYVNGGFQSFTVTDRSKARFIKNYLRQVFAASPDLVIVGHISLSPLALIRPPRRMKTVIVAYGIEAWRDLPWAERRALQKSDLVLAISDYTKSEIVRRNNLPPEKVKVFPCSLDPYWITEPESAPPSAAPPIILTVSRLEKEDSYKGVDNVIRSLPAVVQKLGAVDYRVVGRGDDIPRLKKLAEDAGVSEYVTFTGAMSESELREHYRRCSIFVMPSEGEGFGIVFLEAMAYAKPVIGGAHAGTLSVVEDGKSGLLVNRSDVAGLSRLILQTLTDDELRKRLGRAGRERLTEMFTFDRFEANLDSLLRDCL